MSKQAGEGFIRCRCGKWISSAKRELLCTACLLAVADRRRLRHGPDGHGPGNPDFVINQEMHGLGGRRKRGTYSEQLREGFARMNSSEQ